MSHETPTRDELASLYLDQLPYEPYPVQEEALLSLVLGRTRGARLCADGYGKNADCRSGSVRGTPHGTTRLLHDAPDCVDRTEADRDAAGGGAVGLPGGRCGARHRQSPGEPGCSDSRRGRGDSLQSPAPPRGLCLRRRGCGGDGRVSQFQRSGARHRLGVHARPAAAAGSPLVVVGHGRQRLRVQQLDAPCSPAIRRTCPEHGSQDPADLSVGGRPAAQRANRRDGRRGRNGPPHTGPRVLFQPRGVLERGRAVEGKTAVARGSSAAVGQGTGGPRLVAGGRAQTQADPAARRRRAPRRSPAQVSPDRRGLVPAEAAFGLRVHGDVGGRDQSAGPERRAARFVEGSPRQAEADRPECGAPDVRAGRASSVRQPRLHILFGARGRRADSSLAREVRPDSGNDEGPGTAQSEKGFEEEDADAECQSAVLERIAIHQADDRARPPDSPAAVRSPGGCSSTCWMPPRRSNRFGSWSASG